MVAKYERYEIFKDKNTGKSCEVEMIPVPNSRAFYWKVYRNDEVVQEGKSVNKTQAKKQCEAYARNLAGIVTKKKEYTKEDYQKFAKLVLDIQKRIDFKISVRGWCYQLESEGLYTKGQFDEISKLLKGCRTKYYLLPYDLVAEEEARAFSGVEKPTSDTSIIEMINDRLNSLLNPSSYWYTPDWWEGETYYIQMLVEKIDLKTLFEEVCLEYHIPIATTKGWSSILQKAEYGRRFKEAEERGLKPVLLYCGDLDPSGELISENIKKNLEDMKNGFWYDGTPGYDPTNLDVKRFGLNEDFVEKHHLTWIDSLETGSKGYYAKEVSKEVWDKTPEEQKVEVHGKFIIQGKNKEGKLHPDFTKPYVKKYLKKYGVKKCEANALVPHSEIARKLAEDSIKDFLKKDAKKRFEAKEQAVFDKIQQILDDKGDDDRSIADLIKEVIEIARNK